MNEWNRGATWRSVAAAVAFLVYAAPLFWPPGPVPLGTVTPPDAWLLARIFPGVPAAWVALRLAALAIAVVVLAPLARMPVRGPEAAQETPLRPPRLRWLALAVATFHALCAPFAYRLGPIGQAVYLILLIVPALILARPAALARALRPTRSAAPAAALIVVWILLRLATDLNAPRAAHVVDGYLGLEAIATFDVHRKNIVTDVLDPDLPGVGSAMLFFHGMPLFRAGIIPLSFRTMQVAQILWMAVVAAGIGVLAREVIGRNAAIVAVAVFLFAPYTRFVTIFPSPFIIGPLYGTAIVLSALAACRYRSEAALAALGAACGLGVTFPGVLPVAGLCAVATVWHLRDSWRRRWVGFAAGLASFVAVVAPAFAEVFTPRVMVHFRYDGLVEIIEPALLGQLPLAAFSAKLAGYFLRPFDIVVAALIAPFAHPRMSVRLWGDAVFDPVGAALVAIGIVACVRAAVRRSRRAWVARSLLLLLLAALSPAFVSPVDVVNVAHALVLPVPIALLAAAGFQALGRVTAPRRARAAALATAATIAVGGSVLFDVVNPRILTPGSFGIMFRVLAPDALDRVVALDYPKGFNDNAKRWLFTGPVTAFTAVRPVGYLEYTVGSFPAADLAAEAKDLLFWSRGLELDLGVSAAVCAQWPGATVYEIWDDAHIGAAYAARIADRPWDPRAPAEVWRSWSCRAGPAA